MSYSYVIICVHRKCSYDILQYVIDGLTSHKLLIKKERRACGQLVLHISISRNNLFRLAELLHLKKLNLSGYFEEFTIAKNERFIECSGGEGPLTRADVQRCLLHLIESIPHPASSVSAPLISFYRELGLLICIPLHDTEYLKKLYGSWSWNNLLNPPLEQIREYFGENVALYFSFITFYTLFLIPLSILGIMHYCFDSFSLFTKILFSGCNLVALTIFLELWKRRSNGHSYDWQTLGKLRHKHPRPEFRGIEKLSTVTGKLELTYPMQKTVLQALFVSFPIIVTCLLVALFMMAVSFKADIIMIDLLKDQAFNDGNPLIILLPYLPSAIYSLLILIFNQFYLKLAHLLTQWENHRTEEQFATNLVLKLVLFEFVNTFVALFYSAFYMTDVTSLRMQVLTMLIVQQGVNQLQETVLPIYMGCPSSRKGRYQILPPASSLTLEENDNENDWPLVEEELELQLRTRHPFDSTCDDYMELWLQFGHVFLFSSVCPLAACLALINNIFELRIDAYKFCWLAMKPIPRALRDIGAWYGAFDLIIVVSVVTNCILMAMDPVIQEYTGQSNAFVILLFVEHIFFGLRFIIDKIIPDVPKRVKQALDRDDYYIRHLKNV